MIRYRLHASEFLKVIVTLPVSKPNQVEALRYEGEPEVVERIRFSLETSFGLRGHGLGKKTQGGDLDYAMKSETMLAFKPELLEGGELIDEYQLPNVPEGLDD